MRAPKTSAAGDALAEFMTMPRPPLAMSMRSLIAARSLQPSATMLLDLVQAAPKDAGERRSRWGWPKCQTLSRCASVPRQLSSVVCSISLFHCEL
jgi:hypothetical protein